MGWMYSGGQDGTQPTEDTARLVEGPELDALRQKIVEKIRVHAA